LLPISEIEDSKELIVSSISLELLHSATSNKLLLEKTNPNDTNHKNNNEKSNNNSTV